MKLITRTILLSAAVLAAFSCSKQDGEGRLPQDTLRIVESPTKISLNKDFKTVWNASDKVSVFYRSGTNEEWAYEGADGASTGVLKHVGTRTETGSDIVALYPYDKEASLSGKKVSTTLPRIQKRVPGSFDPAAALMASLADGDELFFRYATGVVRLTLEKRVTADSIVLRGGKGSEILCGKGTIPDPSAPAFAPEGGASSVKMVSSDGSPMAFSAGETLYFCVAPGFYPAGFSFDVYISKGERKSINYGIPTDLSAGHLCDISGSVTETLTLNAVFSIEAPDGTLTKNNPFTEAPSASMAGSLTKEFFLQEYPDKYPFRFFVSTSAASYRLGVNSAGSGLQIGGSPHDYILLPGIEGYCLSSVSIHLGQSTGQYGVSENPASGVPASVKGGEILSVTARDTHIFSLSGTQPGVAYRLELMREASTFIRTLTLIYEK